MYERILLAYDGSVEGRAALREGALLALRLSAQVMFLSVIPDSPGMKMAEGAHAGAVDRQRQSYRDIFEEGLQKLREFDLNPVAKMVCGDPAKEIGAFARDTRADLIVVSHRRQSLLSRWWSGPSGAYISDYTDCSLLIGRNTISDAAFKAELDRVRKSRVEAVDAH